MSDSYIHACYNCAKTFSSRNGRDSNLACSTCGHTATYLCPKSQWQELDTNARVALYNNYAPNENARLATENTRGSHASPEAADDSTPCNDKKPLILGLVGAAFFVFAGQQMLGITSVATSKGDGGSIAEAFYHTMGWFSFGMAFLSATLGHMGWKK